VFAFCGKELSLGASLILWKLIKTLLTSNNSPLSACSTSYSILSFSSPLNFTPSPSWFFSSFVDVHSAKVITFLLTQSDGNCPNPWHLKRQILLGVWDFSCEVGWFVELGDFGVYEGFSHGVEWRIRTPLLKVCSYSKGWKNECWNSLNFLWFSTLWANNRQTSSKVKYRWSSTTLGYLRFKPPNYLTIVWSLDS